MPPGSYVIGLALKLNVWILILMTSWTHVSEKFYLLGKQWSFQRSSVAVFDTKIKKSDSILMVLPRSRRYGGWMSVTFYDIAEPLPFAQE